MVWKKLQTKWGEKARSAQSAAWTARDISALHAARKRLKRERSAAEPHAPRNARAARKLRGSARARNHIQIKIEKNSIDGGIAASHRLFFIWHFLVYL